MSTPNLSPESTCDVLVVGAGPSGLMAGQALARLGLQVRLVERRVPGALHGNADGLQPRTLEIWKSYGILEEILSKGAAIHAMVGYGVPPGADVLARAPPTNNVVVPARFPFEATASITDIENTLRKNGEAAGLKIDQPCRPISLEVADEAAKLEYPVKVLVEHSEHSEGRKEVINAKYVVGADGASSWVRRAVGIEMEGEQTEGVSGVIDVLVDTDFPDTRCKCIIRGKTGIAAIIPREGDKIRFYVQMFPQDNIPRDAEGKVDRSKLVDEEVREKILARIKNVLEPTYKIEFPKVFWHTIFSAAQRVATRFSHKNRVFIVGDACHTHSPNAGQGANVSMGDAHNLAWKLAHVLRGWASPLLLETYEAERRIYAESLIAFDKELGAVLAGRSAPTDYAKMIHQQNLFTSGMGITYASSPLTLQPADPIGLIVPGESFLPCSITRLADWQTIDVHDLLVSNGLYKLLILPGDIAEPTTKSRLEALAKTLSNSLQKENFSPRIETYTITRSAKEGTTWKEVPSSIVQSWRSCLTVKGKGGEDIYEKFKIASIEEGVLVLVRPDGYISGASKLTPGNAQRMVEFVSIDSVHQGQSNHPASLL